MGKSFVRYLVHAFIITYFNLIHIFLQCTWISFWVQLFLSLIKKWWFRNAPNLAKIIIYEIGLTALKNRLIALLIFIFFYNMSHLKLYNMRNVQCIHPLYGYVKNLNASYFRFRWICRTDIMHLSSIVLLKIRYPHYNAIFVQYNSYDANTVPFVSM